MLSKRDSKFKKGDKPLTAEAIGVPNVAAAYLKSLEDPEVIEITRCHIADAHIFKLPSSGPPTVAGWRGADWTQQVWQGTLKVVERGGLTVILLLDTNTGKIFAVVPVQEGAVDRCVDSSRYFVLRVENASNGQHMFVGMAFNERNDAFDFNTSLEDSKREKQAEEEALKAAARYSSVPPKDYSIKEGEKIRISVNKVAKVKKDKKEENEVHAASACKEGGKVAPPAFLRPSKKDTPRRINNNS
jgi:adaptin ear-binding coat-associated protein 1/2